MLVTGSRRRLHCARIALIASGVALAAPSIGAGGTQPRERPINFPYQFPIDAAVLQKWIDDGNESALRQRSWYLWAGINQPGRDHWPIWASWNTATQVFAPTPQLGGEPPPAKGLAVINKKNRASAPIQVDQPTYEGAVALKDGQRFQNNDDLMLASEAYSQDGYNWIRNEKLFERTTLTTLQQKGKTDIPQMPRTSIVLKHMYWPVKREGLTALPVVDMNRYETSAVPNTTYVGFENQKRWPRAVAIDPSGRIPAGETRSVTYLYHVLAPEPNATAPLAKPLGPLTYPKAKVVPITDFYFKQLSKSEFSKMGADDQKLINAVFRWAHDREFEDGDYLVSVGSHIITKETPGWTLQTLWWSDEPNATKYAKDRPLIPGARGPWQHYLLVTEDGTSKGATVPIAYNPYIEPAAGHPVATNCRNCHMRADLPSAQYLASNCPPAAPSFCPPALANLSFKDPVFQGQLRTDFLWTIVDRALPVPPSK